MTRTAYYAALRAHARAVRAAHGWDTLRITVTHFRRLYDDEGITLHYWPPPHVQRPFRALRGAYVRDEYGPTVMVARHLPSDPKIFTLGHELKHHLHDAETGRTLCAASNEHEEIEIGAEAFSAELIFPEGDFSRLLNERGVQPGACTQEDLVRLKEDTGTPLSYTSLRKRACFLGSGDPLTLPTTGWRAIHERLYGSPIYRLMGRGRPPKRHP